MTHDASGHAFQSWRARRQGPVSRIEAFRAGWHARKGIDFATAYGGSVVRSGYSTDSVLEMEAAMRDQYKEPPMQQTFERNALFGFMRADVIRILDKPLADQRQWSVQGFGMLRTYFSAERSWRLNVWDSALGVPNVSIVHDHPWDFRSWILAGTFRNVRYSEHETRDMIAPATAIHPNFAWQDIVTGEGGGPVPNQRMGMTLLVPEEAEHYKPGDTYAQKAKEIHASFPEDGCTTINLRSNRNGENARVFWPFGTQWVDAEPRGATADEVMRTCAKALAKFETITLHHDHM